MLGRTIGWDGQARLLMVRDYYGLPVDVILTMLSYLNSIGKTSSSEITKLAKYWAENDITTHEAANGYIDRMNDANEVFEDLKMRFGLGHERPSTKQAQFISDWISSGYSRALIIRAYDEMVNNTEKPSFAYVNKILINWDKQGIKTTDDVDKAEDRKNAPAPKKGKSASYDIEKAKQRDKTRKLKYEKKVSN